MIVSIDATALHALRTGTVTYVTEIVKRFNQIETINPASTHQYPSSAQNPSIDRVTGFVLFVTARNRHHFDNLNLDHRFSIVQAPAGRVMRTLWQQVGLVWQLWRRRVSVHWGPTFILPWYAPCPCVVTVHDMTFDLYPEAHERLKRFYFPFMIRRAVARARTVLAVSKHTASDLAHLIPTSASKTEITLLAASEPSSHVRVSQALPFEPPFLLSVGTREPRKNLPRLLAAWQQLDPVMRGKHRLVVAGAMGWLLDDLEASLSDDPSIILAGHLPDEQLQACLQAAKAFVYPSLYEGFGLPVLEAMAAGVPVLTSRVGATLEVAGHAALLVDPASVSDIRDAMAQLLSDDALCQRLARAGKARAQDFSWETTARLTLSAIAGAGAAHKTTVR